MQHSNIITLKQLTKISFHSLSIRPELAHQDYYTLLKHKGLILNPKLKNGLPYVGMAANSQILGGQVLIRIPEELVLSSVKALQQSELDAVFNDSFFLNTSDWEDRIIIVYFMFLLHRGQVGNLWYQMVRRFPKQCDIACFWPCQELDQFKDITIKQAVALDLINFENQWQQFELCQKKYTVLQHPEYCKQNYKMVLINLTNRSFGKHINYVSMIPFFELFNHHCSKVSYSVQTKHETYLKDQIQDTDSNDQSSVGSCDSNQYLEEGEFAYEQVKGTPFDWEVQEFYQLHKLQRQKVLELSVLLLQSLEKQLNWQDFTILFVGPLQLKIRILKKQYLVGRRSFLKAMHQLEVVGKTLKIYQTKVTQFYRVTKKRPYLCKPEGSSESQVASIHPKYKKQFESVIIKTGKGDRFECNNQIYFRYGKNSNRSLLLRYGFAIEGNKYQHVWISIDITQYLANFPDVLNSLMDRKSSMRRKFKIYYHTLNLDIILFFRLKNWTFYNDSTRQIFSIVNISKEISILEQVSCVLEHNLRIYKGDYDLTDNSLTYHQYFMSVYHLQKYNILQKQIYMISRIIQILRAIQRGLTKQAATAYLTKTQNYILKYYLEQLNNQQ